MFFFLLHIHKGEHLAREEEVFQETIWAVYKPLEITGARGEGGQGVRENARKYPT